MDLQNIQDQLNTEFAKSETRIIFWFDDKGEYEDEVSELQLGDVKLHILDGTNWLYSKYLLNSLGNTMAAKLKKEWKLKFPTMVLPTI